MIIPKEKHEFWYLMTMGELPERRPTCGYNNHGYRVISYGRIIASLEHRIIMEEWLCRKLGKKEVVHHVNGITDDNRIENLMLCNGTKEHFSHHPRQRGLKRGPWSVEKKASVSGENNHNWKGGTSQGYKRKIKNAQTLATKQK